MSCPRTHSMQFPVAGLELGPLDLELCKNYQATAMSYYKIINELILNFLRVSNI